MSAQLLGWVGTGVRQGPALRDQASVSGKFGVHSEEQKQILFPMWGFFLFFFFLCCAVRHVELPRPGIEPMPPALGAQSLNHWTTREVLCEVS